jgi:hypothetical protein
MFLSYIGASRMFAASEAARFYASIIWRVADVRAALGQNKPQDAKGLMPRQYMRESAPLFLVLGNDTAPLL